MLTRCRDSFVPLCASSWPRSCDGTRKLVAFTRSRASPFALKDDEPIRTAQSSARWTFVHFLRPRCWRTAANTRQLPCAPSLYTLFFLYSYRRYVPLAASLSYSPKEGPLPHCPDSCPTRHKLWVVTSIVAQRYKSASCRRRHRSQT